MTHRHLPAVLVTLLLALGFSAALAPGSASAATHPQPSQRRDANCSDFSTQAAAQQYFINHGGPNSDPDGLDADGDGVACESNPCPCSTSTGGGGGGGGGTQPPAHRDSYGSIALNVKGKSGTSKHVPTRAGATRQALRACDRGGSPKYRCVRIGTVKNACSAVWFKLDRRGLVVTKGSDKARYDEARTRARAVAGARHGHRGGHVVTTCA